MICPKMRITTIKSKSKIWKRKILSPNKQREELFFIIWFLTSTNSDRNSSSPFTLRNWIKFVIGLRSVSKVSLSLALRVNSAVSYGLSFPRSLST